MHFDDADCKLMDPDWISPEEQIALINGNVRKNDTFICLGDVGNPEYIQQINAHWKVLLLGNHDPKGAYREFFDDAPSYNPNAEQIKGKICSIKFTFSAQYGTATFNISDDGATGGKEFIAYSCYYFGNQPWVEGNTQVQVGDEVVVCGKVVNYGGNTPEFASKKNYLVKLNSQTAASRRK
jgi:hypothetical protein